MNDLLPALASLSPEHDEELDDGYRRYTDLLSTFLAPEDLVAYAGMIRRLGGLPVFEDMTPEQIAELSPQEQALATQVVANEMASMENRRVVALLTQRGFNPDPATNEPLNDPYMAA